MIKNIQKKEVYTKLDQLSSIMESWGIRFELHNGGLFVFDEEYACSFKMVHVEGGDQVRFPCPIDDKINLK